MNNLGNRLKMYCQSKGLKNKDLVPILRMTEQKIGTILNGKYQGSFEEFEYIVSKISSTPDEEYYYCTGKTLPSSAPAPDVQQQMLDVVQQLLEEVRELRQEIKLLREVNSSAQVRLPQKVPEHH